MGSHLGAAQKMLKSTPDGSGHTAAPILDLRPNQARGRSNMYSNDDDREDAPYGEVERRRKPFVPDPNRVMYPANPAVSERYALAKFDAEIGIVVGAQLSKRIVAASGDLKDEIRNRARDAAHYALLEQVHLSFVGKSMKRRDRFMDSGDEQRYRQ